MRAAHFDCFSGISGDMTLGALIDAGVAADAIREGIASLGLPITLRIAKVRKGGFAATQVSVDAPEEDEERHLPEVEEILGRGQLTPTQRDLALRIFRRLAEAEAAVHGMPIENVHFHEVGALDSIADIAGAAIGLDLLGAERITCGAVTTGIGMVKCAHGLMPVPTPATAEMLKGVPLRPSSIKAELTTPTGAAILATVVNEWVDSPAMKIEHIGHGAGQRDLLEQPNILRLFVGETLASRNTASRDRQRPEPASDEITVLETNLDDVPAEVIGYCFDQLFAAGALDVFTIPIHMKKNRPGTLLSVLAPEEAVPALEAVLFRETGTLGIRRYQAQRRKMQRREASVQTPWGPVKGKLAWLDGQAPRFSPEFEECARLARAHNIALHEVFAAAQQGQPG